MAKIKIKHVKPKGNHYIPLKLNKHNASVLICGIAFLCRYMYYGKVEHINIKEFYDNEDFENYYFELRLLLFYLINKSKETFAEYEELKIIK